MNSPMKVGLACVLCAFGVGASVAAEVEVSIPNGNSIWHLYDPDRFGSISGIVVLDAPGK